MGSEGISGVWLGRAATLAPPPPFYSYIVAKVALGARGRGGRKGTATFLQTRKAPLYTSLYPAYPRCRRREYLPTCQ